VAGDKEITGIRKHWEELTNEYLKSQGIEARIDHRSLEAQGIDREPQSHLGPAVSGMQRRGMETQVGERLERESLSRAQERLERAAELGRLERERGQLERSIVDLSGDLSGAKRERELMMLKQPIQKPTDLEAVRAQARANWLQYRAEQLAKERAPAAEPSVSQTPTPERQKPLSIEEQQREARERWLALREEQKAREREAQPEKSSAAELSPSLILDEQRRQAAERWLEYRNLSPEARQARDVEMERERRLEKGPERSQGLDGPEID